MIALLIKDIFFQAQIADMAKKSRASVRFADRAHGIREACLIIVELEAFEPAVAHILKEQNPHARLVGYCPHVKTKLREQALDAGFELVLPNSGLAKELPELISDVSR